MSKVVVTTDRPSSVFSVADNVLTGGRARSGDGDSFVIAGTDDLGDFRIAFSGQNFTFNAAGFPVSGRATSIQLIDGGEVGAEISDVNISAAKLRALSTPEEFLKLLGDIEFLGGPDSDALGGAGGDDTLRGREGADTLAGGGGDDKLFGGAGEDVFFSSRGRDSVDGGEGRDIWVYLDGTRDLTLSLAKDGFQRIGGGDEVKFVFVEDLAGGEGDDRLSGDALGNRIAGGGLGADTLSGGGGADTLYGGPGADDLKGGEGVDTASFEFSRAVTVSLGKIGRQNTGEGKDRFDSIENVIGSTFGDRLTGDGRANLLTGGDGADTLTGGRGADTLFGGDDLDVYRFTSIDPGVADIVSSFEDGEKIDLTAIDANRLADGNQSFFFIAGSAFSGAAGQLRCVQPLLGPPAVIQGDIDGDGAVDFEIVLAVARHFLDVGDFLL